MNIISFKKGDSIVRVEPAKSLGPMINIFGSGEPIDRGGDRSYMGELMIFVGIANGQIYLKRTDAFSLKMFGDKLVDLPTDLWSDGWEYWIDPESLMDENFQVTLNDSSLNEIRKQYEEAIKKEDFELAEQLKRQYKL